MKITRHRSHFFIQKVIDGATGEWVNIHVFIDYDVLLMHAILIRKQR